MPTSTRSAPATCSTSLAIKASSPAARRRTWAPPTGYRCAAPAPSYRRRARAAYVRAPYALLRSRMRRLIFICERPARFPRGQVSQGELAGSELPTYDGPKREWPELVGIPAEAAQATVSAERPDVTVQFLMVGDVATTDFKEDRVRLWIGEAGVVAEPPKIG